MTDQPMPSIIRFESVSKRYRLVQRRNLREAIANLPRGIIGQPVNANSDDQYLWALREVDFQVQPGEVVGIIGSNGAGKSTILKLIAGITRPTRGQVEIRGRVGSLIELGAGFHPDLTGRENVVLNCQLMGMSRKEISSRYDSIVEFAELLEFMDVPVKRYSTGMYARLAFAVASHADIDILLVDEVLSVGDASFQRKSLERMLALVKSGKTIVFVSHNLFAIEQMCDRVLWLARGRIRKIGQAGEVIHDYLSDEENRFVRAGEHAPKIGKEFCIERVELMNDASELISEFHGERDIEIQIEYRATKAIEGLRFGLGIANASGLLFTANMLMDGKSLSAPAGPGVLRCRFKNVPLKPGAYQILGEVWGHEGYEIIAPWSEWARFRMTQVDALQIPLAQVHSVAHLRADAPIYVPYEWYEVSR